MTAETSAASVPPTMTADAADHHKEHEMTEPEPAPTAERTVEQICADHMARRLTAIAVKLRELGEVADREARNIRTRGGRATYASVATEVQHDVLWGVANLHLDQLTTDAQQADEYRIKGE